MRIRNARLDRFSIDRLMTILNRFHQRVEVSIRVRPMRPVEGGNRRVAKAR